MAYNTLPLSAHKHYSTYTFKQKIDFFYVSAQFYEDFKY